MATSLHEPVPCPARVPVSMRALIQRINRHLAKSDEMLKASRGRAAQSAFGTYYVLHWHSNTVRAWHVDPVALARELGVLEA
jgi:hypothetical protein